MIKNAATIALNKGLVTIVDIDMYTDLSQYKWRVDPSGYAATTVYLGGGKPHGYSTSVLMHHLIIYVPAGMVADHINGNMLDNRRCNLRAATKAQNAVNVTRHMSRNKSGYRGVSWRPEKGKWRAAIKWQGRHMHLGYFDDLEQAARAYDRAAERYYGEHTFLNARYAGLKP